MKKWLIVLISFCVVNVCMSQTLRLSTDAKKVIQGSTFTAKYELNGGKISQFQKIDFSPFEVVAGPNRSSSISNVNGKVNQKESYTYTLYTDKIGTYEVPAATIISNGKTIRSNTTTIEFVKGTSANAIPTDKKEIKVKIETSTEEAILGEQITISYKLYTQTDVNGYDILNESEYDGFFVQELRNYRSEVSREIIDGKEFYTKVLKRVALFPQRTGVFEFPPIKARLAIPIPGARPRGFFSSVPTRNRIVESDGIKINVKSPPSGAPISFSGAVGKYAMIAKLDKRKISTDDAFVMTMELRGTGDGKTFSAAQQPPLDNFEYYDPNVVRDEDTSKDGIISNYKRIEYLIVPKKKGSYVIYPEFTYYDTDSNDYVTLYSNRTRVQVTQGNRSIVRDDRNISVLGDLKPNKDKLSSMSLFSLTYFDWFWVLGLLGSIGAIGFMYFNVRKQWAFDALDKGEKKKRMAEKIANEKLSKAKEHLLAGDKRKYYEEISSMMNGYLGDKYSISNTDFDKKTITDRLQIANVPQNYIDQYLGIIKECEMALFAGQGKESLDDTLEACRNLILALED